MLTRITMTGVAALVATGTGWGQWMAAEEAKLIASDSAQFDEFGTFVAIFGDTAIAGAPGDDHAGGADAGSAYVFVRNGPNWMEQQKLVASGAQVGDLFGSSVAISGDTAIVGAPGDHQNEDYPGSVYVFVRSGSIWSQQAKLTASDGQPDDKFGHAVAVLGDMVVVGARWDDLIDDVTTHDQGSAYVFVRNGASWIEEAKLVASDPGFNDEFGVSVALFDDMALIGASGNDSAYLFARNGTIWTQQQKLTASTAASNDRFGWSVALWDDIALIGAPQALGAGAGSAFVFVREMSTWTELQEITASDAQIGDQFGHAVALSAGMALIGSHRDDDGGTSSGSAYLFVESETNWSEQVKVVASAPISGAQFGWSVALSGSTAVVGANEDFHSSNLKAGSAYVFGVSSPVEIYCTAGSSASGCQASLSASGVPSASASSGFDLLTSGVEGSKDGLFYFGTHGQQANPWGNGTSYQCVVPPVVRTPTTAGVGTIGLCDGSFALDLNAHWCPTCPKPAKNPGAGATVQAQLWYRDPLSTSNQTTSLSDAIEFVVAP